jgi:hypothetical protein
LQDEGLGHAFEISDPAVIAEVLALVPQSADSTVMHAETMWDLYVALTILASFNLRYTRSQVVAAICLKDDAVVDTFSHFDSLSIALWDLWRGRSIPFSMICWHWR